MGLLTAHLVECLLALAAMACACATRPWRLLAHGARHDLLAPLVLAAILVPAAWWWPGQQWGALLSLLGAQLVLLSLGWPLAILVFGWAAAWGVLVDHATWTLALSEAFWRGVAPATLGLAAGAALRHLFGARVVLYLCGRAFLLPLAITTCCALAALEVRGDFASLGLAAWPAIFLAALGDAMLTGTIVVLLVASHPARLATWSDDLYLGQDPAGHRVLRSTH